ncbi:membrane dipeptidase family protein [Xanthomonas citri pv. mangiferaeindicae]|nr:membrane dipeptidase family protein [Xanthomonas citri pv. mangiferaeindicae]
MSRAGPACSEQFSWLRVRANQEHLSFGSDFDGGISSLPTGMRSGADLPKLTQAMLDAGWPTQRIVDVYSGNFLRIWERVRP